MKTVLKAMLLVGITTAAFAHSGVKDPDVKARMHLMGQIGTATGVLGNMARGTLDYNAEAASQAREALIKGGNAIAEAFQTEAHDPKTEARPAIWENWPDFVAKAAVLEDAARAMDPGSLVGVRTGMGAIGKSCGGCHEDYRVKK